MPISSSRPIQIATASGRDSDEIGEMKLLTGNQIGSLLAWYRVKALFDRGVLNKRTRRAA